jgi:hypothetical protein
MEHVSGCPLSAVPKSKMKIAEYRCGIWLALYHNKMLGGSPKGLIYTDLNAHNIILDFEQKRVTAIDPGMTWGRSGYIYEDVVKHINSVLMTLVLRRKSPCTAMMSFLRGYAEVIQLKLNLFLYYKGLYRELKRQFLNYSKQSYLKFVSFFLVVCALSPLYYVWIPSYLLNKQGAID